MSDETTLLPCPFCGGEASVKVLEYDDDCKVWGVFCESDLECEYSHGHFVDNYPTEAEAIAAWNTRAELGSGTCEWLLEHSGTLYDKWRCSKCGYLHVESRTDGGATDLAPNFCPNCGRKVVS